MLMLIPKKPMKLCVNVDFQMFCILKISNRLFVFMTEQKVSSFG